MPDQYSKIIVICERFDPTHLQIRKYELLEWQRLQMTLVFRSYLPAIAKIG